MAEPKRVFLSFLFYSLAILVLCCTIIGAGLLVASNAFVVKAVIPLTPLSDNESGEVTQRRQAEAMLALEYVTGRSEELKSTVELQGEASEQWPEDGRPTALHGLAGSYAADETSHMTDVRSVMKLGRGLTLFLIAASLLAIGIAIKLKAYGPLRWVLTWAGYICIALPMVAVAVGFIGFDALFSAFHSLFFADGTWQFPENSLLLSTFPLSFWMAEALVWTASSLIIAAAVLLLRPTVRFSCVAKRTSRVN